MVPLPKRRHAKARQGERRSHLHLDAPAIEHCKQCNSVKLPHHVCPTCGTYDGREVIAIKSSSSTENKEK